MSKICAVHLVREKNGIAPLQRFLSSYKQYQAGIDHELLIIFKGFDRAGELDNYYSLLNGLSYRSLFVADYGFDIRPYFIAAQSFNFQYFCFLNSYSVILDDDWLGKMHKHFARADVGLVGASGSYMSHYSTAAHSGFVKSGSLLRDTWRNFSKRVLIKRYKLYFPPFPNYHIRTNAFMLAQHTMLKLKPGALHSKWDVLKFESGKRSLTRQIFDMNLQALVVGRDGEAYGKEEWCESGTFWIGDQQNLLVADNRTMEYLQADSFTKKMWSGFAWGNR